MRRRAPTTFPSYTDAPLALLRTDGHCGLLAAWSVARYFRKRTRSARLFRQCGYTRRYGVFTFGIACALAEMGLKVKYFTEPDADVKPLERRLYLRAKRLGVPILPATDVQTLAASLRHGGIPIVFYDTDEGAGHFSPLLGIMGRNLLLPHSDRGLVPRDEFERAWRADGICRQAVLAEDARTAEGAA